MWSPQHLRVSPCSSHERSMFVALKNSVSFECHCSGSSLACRLHLQHGGGVRRGEQPASRGDHGHRDKAGGG